MADRPSDQSEVDPPGPPEILMIRKLLAEAKGSRKRGVVKPRSKPKDRRSYFEEMRDRYLASFKSNPGDQ